MNNMIGILRNTLESMVADADDKGCDAIRPVLTFEDVKVILNALKLAEPVTCEDKKKNILQSEFAATIEGMTSPDYKDRFVAEYEQTKIRYNKLHGMLVKADAGTLDFTPTCPLELLREQKAAMGKYLYCLEVRAEVEKISL